MKLQFCILRTINKNLSRFLNALILNKFFLDFIIKIPPLLLIGGEFKKFLDFFLKNTIFCNMRLKLAHIT